jgi:integrase
MIQSLYVRLGEHLGPATVRQIASIVHASLADAVRQGVAIRNPAANATPPSVPDAQRTVWTPEQITAYLLDARDTATPSVFAFYVAMIGTGCRPGELLGAAEDAVNLEHRPALLHVRQTLVRAGRAPTFGQPKTAKGRRTVVLPEEVAAAIRVALVWKKEQRLRRGTAFRDGGTLFCTHRGRPLDRRVLRARDYLPRIRRTGLPEARLYDLRHANITYAIASGVDPRTAADRVGHTDPGYMLQRYAHAVTAAQERAAEVANTLLVLSRPAGR